MLKRTGYLHIEADASPMLYDKPLEEYFAANETVSGLVKCGENNFWLYDIYRIESWKVDDKGIRSYILRGTIDHT